MTPLPTTKTKPTINLSELTTFIYGPPGVGKTTLASQFPDALILATEAGHKAIEGYIQPVTSWEGFRRDFAEIKSGKHQFKTIIIDTIDNLFDLCRQEVFAKNNIKHESDFGYGKGFSLVRGKFKSAMTQLSMLPYGLVLISHSDTKTITPRAGREYDRTMSTLQEKVHKVILGMSDIIMYIDLKVKKVDGKEITSRVAFTQPSMGHDAKDRTGRLPPYIKLSDLDDNPIGFQEFMAYISGKKNKNNFKKKQNKSKSEDNESKDTNNQQTNGVENSKGETNE